ncbi:DUF3618 domain-containing protein [Streptosporangium carneum]|uniref:DUF3618 domain-containing protein n=1 Tax=Streptosporangium carneum TaxID=47481 RepID=A0A9W6I9E9_9ACTN|nr:DUF3618 domain-containing protein [Streptosporangium carneum]GLK13355.1 hypothetical protein GCM10017600_67660 [Streptosporangium carneum]
MTETDPERPDHETLDAGTVGARRQEVGESVRRDEEMSLNLPPKAPGGVPSADLGLPPSELDGTPRLAEGATGGAEPERTASAAPGAASGASEGGRTARAVEAGTATAATPDVAGAGEAGGGGARGKTDDRTSKESVRRDIENDRRELGDTVEALVHKTDVKGRVHETAAQVGDELRRVGAATATTATEVVSRVREAAPEMVGRVKEVTPVEVKDAAEKVTTQVGKRPVATVAAVAVLALVVVRLLRRGRKR